MLFEKEIGKLGFGLMRLPSKGDVIDIEQVKQMVDRFMDAGFTYFDTAWAYAGSEEAIRQALVERYPRAQYQLATKLAAWIGCKTRDDAVAQFETSLQRTGAGFFDFYLLHNLGENRTHFFDDFDLWDFVRELKAKGLIRHYGFSFHSTPDELEKILNEHPDAEFVQLQINYADWEDPAICSRGVYEVARRHDKPIIVMEPLKGGMLARPPQSVRDILRQAEPDSSEASWGIRFAAGLDGVLTVLSGMSDTAQMDDNLAYMRGFTGLGAEQLAVIRRAQEALAAIPLIPCTSCNYCAKVCPMEIGISGTFTAKNAYTLFGDLNYAKGRERWLVTAHDRQLADKCIGCGACEEVCPQHIRIREELASAVHLLSENAK